jgi:EAL domain-containing protein (putative c-di-GMP-specific phosphodiesterase class I)
LPSAACGFLASLAEDTGLIHQLGQYVLERATKQAREWHLEYRRNPPLSLSVNLSAREIQHPDVVELVSGVLRASGLPPSALVLEITESALMHDTEASLKRLFELKKLGVRLAIDDFGTGYSSLSYLRRFPVDILKIDKSFIENVATRTDAVALVRAIVDLGRSLKLSTVAEGVELPEQAAELRALGCEMAQGYLFSRPLEPAAVSAVLGSRAAATPLGRLSLEPAG